MGHTIQVNEETLLADIERRLVDEFRRVAPAVVNTLIRKEHARFETSQIRDFVPLLVEKCARRELKRTPSISPMGVCL
jgi:pheromone shutdown protein TraB